MDVIVDRCAGLDVHKATVMATVRWSDEQRKRTQETKEFSTFHDDLVELRSWLQSHGVSQVAMEATGVYWKPVWRVLSELDNVALVLANPQHIKNVPGRKTDVADSQWLAQLLECGLLRGSFVPPQDISRLRDLTRYRTKLTQQRTSETLRVQKVLEDAGIKLDVVASDVLGVSGRAMIRALINGERDPILLANLAKASLRGKTADLRRALVGDFDDHHAMMLTLHLGQVEQLEATIADIDKKVDELMVPFDQKVARLITIPGINKRAAEVIIAETGGDMTVFPTAKHLASWTGLCPGNHESAGKRKSGRSRQGNKSLQSTLCQSATTAARSKDGYLPARHGAFRRTFGTSGKAKATFALAHTLVVVVWHVLANDCDYEDLGNDFLDKRRDAKARERYLINELKKLGHEVALTPAA
jgi:transposase